MLFVTLLLLTTLGSFVGAFLCFNTNRFALGYILTAVMSIGLLLCVSLTRSLA